jgi:hypothetical protein
VAENNPQQNIHTYGHNMESVVVAPQCIVTDKLLQPDILQGIESLATDYEQ